MKFVTRYARFIIAGIALLVAFALSVTFSDRGWQFDVNKGGSPVLAGPEPAAGSYNLASGTVLNKVLLQMKEKYVDPTRINPNKMLVHGLDEIQKSVPEIVVTFDKDIDDGPTSMTIQVDTQTKTFRIGKFESLWEMSFKMKDVFRFIQDNLRESEKLKFSDIEYAAINGMLNTLDPHSVLLTPAIYKEMQTQTGGKFGGLGIVIGIRDGGLTVISPIDGTPASRAGVKPGDKITRIDDESTVNMSLNDAVSKLRGDPDTKVAIWVGRKGWSTAKKIELTRAIIKIESVESHLLGNKMGYVKIKSFQANTYTDLRSHLDAMGKKAGGLNGLVLDLRNNPGGLLDQAIKISDTFLSQGTIVSTVGFGNKLRDENKARAHGTEAEYPIVVLVDPGSASASEIVAGALKNHNRAIIVGETTFGKGSVQVIYELMDGSALKLTIAQYLTPGDISIQSVGIVPDIKLVPVTIDDEGVDMFLPSKVTREADLDSHLDHTNVQKGNKPGAILPYYKEREPEYDPSKVEDDKFKEDFAIRFAQRMLKATGTTFERTSMLKKVDGSFQKEAGSELDTITAELAKLKVDWSAGKSPEKPSFDFKFTTDKPGNAVVAGEKVKMTVSVTNTGDAPIYRMRALTEADSGLYHDREFIFGKVDPGQSRAWTVEVEIPKYFQTREEHMMLNFKFMGTDHIRTDEAVVNTKGKKRPHFAFTYALDDSKGNGDGVMQPGEEVAMSVKVTNTGDGDAEKTLAYLRNLSESALFLKKGRDEIPAIKAGASHTFNFTFDVKTTPPKDPMKVEVEIYDEVYKILTSEELILLSEGTNSVKVEKAKGAFTVNKNASVLVAARANASVLADATKGDVLAVVAKAGDMFKVKLAEGLHGWVRAAGGAFKAGGGAPAAKISTRILRTPPSVRVQSTEMSTAKSSYKLSFVATDDNAVQDAYIFVFTTVDGRIKSRKVAYKRGGDSTLKLDANVPLDKGMNRIRIYVRDADDMLTDETVFVFRK